MNTDTPQELTAIAGGMNQLPHAAARVLSKHGRAAPLGQVRAASVTMRIQNPRQRAVAGLPTGPTPFRFARAMAMAIRPHDPSWGQCYDSPSISPDMIEEFRQWAKHAGQNPAPLHCTAFRLMGAAYACLCTVYPTQETLVDGTLDLRVQCPAAGLLDALVWAGALTVVHEALANAGAMRLGELLVHFPEIVTTDETLAGIAAMDALPTGRIYADCGDSWQSLVQPVDSPAMWVRETALLASGQQPMGLTQHAIRKVVSPMLAIEKAWNDGAVDPAVRYAKCEQMARALLHGQPDWLAAVALCVHAAHTNATMPKQSL